MGASLLQIFQAQCDDHQYLRGERTEGLEVVAVKRKDYRHVVVVMMIK
jgi:hypothetical protein